MHLFLLLLIGLATASEGPWTTPVGIHNLYAGLYMERFSCFESMGKTSDECGAGVPMTSAVRQTGLKVFYRYGLSRKLDFAIAGPIATVQSVDETSQDNLAQSTGVGLVETRLRRRLGNLAGLDWSGSVGVRSGALHKDTRGRVTNLGEGSTDAYGTLSMGSTGLLGSRFYTTTLDASYFYRFALQTDDAVGKIPGDEIRVSAVFDLSLSPRVGSGIAFDAAHRLGGVDLDFGKIARFGDDRWAALAVSQFKLGPRVMLFPHGFFPYLQLSAMRVVWARNNPTDALFVEVAIGRDFGGSEP